MQLILSRVYWLFQQKINTKKKESADTKKTVLIFKLILKFKNPEYYSQKTLRKSYQISRNLDELLKSYETNIPAAGLLSPSFSHQVLSCERFDERCTFGFRIWAGTFIRKLIAQYFLRVNFISWKDSTNKLKPVPPKEKKIISK